MANNNFKNQFSNMMNNFQPMDMSAFKNIINKNIEAMNAANQVVMEGWQVAYKKQTEAAQHFAQKNFECMKNWSSNHNPQDMHKSHANLAQELMENVAENAREVLEMSSKAALEVFDIGNKMVSEITKESCSFACQPQHAGAK